MEWHREQDGEHTKPLYAVSRAFCKAGLLLELLMFVVESNVGTLNSDCCGRSPSFGGAVSAMSPLVRV